ncbi:uncharacterized protein LOC143568088 [Bidens hawaiensis]|uniref:uncharacterized protein LOC143568088 n=1 Tax=Bidens hawaiensis TaxID=980011 RepID=UPI00404B1F82
MPSTTPSTATQNDLKRKSNDPGWDYGILTDPNNKDKVKCTLCNKPMSRGINRLKQHIAQIKGNVAPCSEATKEDQIRCRDSLNDNRLKRKGKARDDQSLRAGVNIESDGHDENTTIEDDEMVDSFGVAKPPRSFGPMHRFVDNTINPEDVLNNLKRKNDSFKLMLEAIGQFGRGLPPPTRYEMGYVPKKEVDRTTNLLKPYKEEWKTNGCTIMMDTWSDRKKRSIMNLCVNSKLGTIFLSSKESSDEAHTSEYIYEYVEACIKEVGPENVVQIVTDNASNIMGAAKLLNEKRPTIFWTSCATHTINLMLEGIATLPRYQKVLTKAKALIVFIYAHHKTLAMMRNFTKKRDIVRPGVTRFASAFLTLQSLADKKAQLKQMFTSDEWEKC